MNWETILNQSNIATLTDTIKADTDSWSSFNNSEDMHLFLDNVIQSGRTQDVSFQRECINFVLNVFPLSSDVIRLCFLASPIMRDIYRLLNNGSELHNDPQLEIIICFAKNNRYWRDLKSGLVLFGEEYKSFESYSDIVVQTNENDLAELVDKVQLSEDMLQSFFIGRNEWRDWESAKRIINKYPITLSYDCLKNAAIQQSDNEIHTLSEIRGIDKQLIRSIILGKGAVYNWDDTLDYLAREIILSEDNVFHDIAVRQNCQELFSLYENEYVGKRDLEIIIKKKGYWDDLNSVGYLRQTSIIDDQIVLASIQRIDNQSFISMILADRFWISDLISYWCQNRDLYSDFPSLCWESLLTRYNNRVIASDLEITDYADLKNKLAALTDVIELKVFFINLYAAKGESYVFRLLDALKHRELLSSQFIEDYGIISNASSYVPLYDIIAFKKKYNIDIRVVQATNILFSCQEGFSSYFIDIPDDDKEFSKILNEGFFRRIDKNAQTELGEFYDSYQKLSQEQKHAVLTDEASYLVISSAGSGKTRVIVSKYEYLTKAQGVEGKAIRILAYTKATRKEINQEKLGLDPDKGPARTFHSFANEIIQSSGVNVDYLRDVQEAPNGNDIDHSPREATLFDKMRDQNIERDVNFMNALSLYAISYKPRDRNQNLSFYKDKNGKIGSLKSYQEKVIFDFLADNKVNFAYEEVSEDGRAHPDFTIYREDGATYYYEHFAIDENRTYSPYGQQYLDDAARKIREWGNRLIYTTGAGIQDIGTILSQLKVKLDEISIPLTPMEPEKRIEILREKQDYVTIFQAGIKKCLDVYDIIRETRIPVSEALLRCENDKYAKSFMNDLFQTVIKYYEKLLTINETGTKRIDYTGCIEYALELCKSQKIDRIPWDYILIDEYQDISPLRFEFIKSLRIINPKLKICAVGDDWQSIYSFANSDLSRFIGFEKDWPASRTLLMTKTFRFNKPLLSISTSFLKKGQDPWLVDKCVSPSEYAPEKTELEVIKCNDFSHQVNFIKRVIDDKALEPSACMILARYKSDLTRIRGFFNDNRHNNFQNDDCLMTMHASKGLTRDYIFLVNCNSDVIPSQVEDDTVIKLIRQANSDDKYNEERRLFYVAITRASKKTFVLYSGMPSLYVNNLESLLHR